MIRVVAPGKLMIAGEYSVLGPDGAALAVAVAPGLQVEAEPAALWSLARAETEEQWEDGGVVGEDLRFAHTALLATRHDGCRPHALTTRVLHAQGSGDQKPGLGGSASVTVAVVAAVLKACGATIDRDRILRMALEAHRVAQGGRGSGYDIATITHGGLVHWRPTQLAGPGVTEGEARRLELPDGLYLLAGFSGESADTRALLGRLEEHASRDHLATSRSLADLGEPVRALVDAFSEERVAEILQCIDACHGALRRWDVALQLGVLTPPVTRMIELAKGKGAVAKVSGAGGGDSVLAFSDDPERLTAVAEDWRTAGFRPFEVPIDYHGVRST